MGQFVSSSIDMFMLWFHHSPASTIRLSPYEHGKHGINIIILFRMLSLEGIVTPYYYSWFGSSRWDFACVFVRFSCFFLFCFFSESLFFFLLVTSLFVSSPHMSSFACLSLLFNVHLICKHGFSPIGRYCLPTSQQHSKLYWVRCFWLRVVSEVFVRVKGFWGSICLIWSHH